MTIRSFGGRKFLLSIFLLLITFVLVMAGKLIADDFLKIVLATLALYTGANVLSSTKKLSANTV